jgi:hypothetical protein
VSQCASLANHMLHDARRRRARVHNCKLGPLLHYASYCPKKLTSLAPCCRLAIYDTMQYVRCPISTLCVGQAASMASLLLAAGDAGQRRALPHARIMLHQPLGQAEVGTLVIWGSQLLNYTALRDVCDVHIP